MLLLPPRSTVSSSRVVVAPTRVVPLGSQTHGNMIEIESVSFRSLPNARPYKNAGYGRAPGIHALGAIGVPGDVTSSTKVPVRDVKDALDNGCIFQRPTMAAFSSSTSTKAAGFNLAILLSCRSSSSQSFRRSLVYSSDLGVALKPCTWPFQSVVAPTTIPSSLTPNTKVSTDPGGSITSYWPGS